MTWTLTFEQYEVDADSNVVTEYSTAFLEPRQVDMDITLPGQQGPQGNTNVFISNAAPSAPPSTYMWLQTGLPNNGMTLWVEDGT